MGAAWRASYQLECGALVTGRHPLNTARGLETGGRGGAGGHPGAASHVEGLLLASPEGLSQAPWASTRAHPPSSGAATSDAPWEEVAEVGSDNILKVRLPLCKVFILKKHLTLKWPS